MIDNQGIAFTVFAINFLLMFVYSLIKLPQCMMDIDSKRTDACRPCAPNQKIHYRFNDWPTDYSTTPKCTNRGEYCITTKDNGCTCDVEKVKKEVPSSKFYGDYINDCAKYERQRKTVLNIAIGVTIVGLLGIFYNKITNKNDATQN